MVTSHRRAINRAADGNTSSRSLQRILCQFYNRPSHCQPAWNIQSAECRECWILRSFSNSKSYVRGIQTSNIRFTHAIGGWINAMSNHQLRWLGVEISGIQTHTDIHTDIHTYIHTDIYTDICRLFCVWQKAEIHYKTTAYSMNLRFKLNVNVFFKRS